jgi:hypothetical protein
MISPVPVVPILSILLHAAQVSERMQQVRAEGSLQLLRGNLL